MNTLYIKYVIDLHSKICFTKIIIFNYHKGYIINIFFLIPGYFPMFGGSGSPFAPVSTKENKEPPPPVSVVGAPPPTTTVPAPPVAPAPVVPKLESSSNVVSSTMDDEERMNIKVNTA